MVAMRGMSRGVRWRMYASLVGTPPCMSPVCSVSRPFSMNGLGLDTAIATISSRVDADLSLNPMPLSTTILFAALESAMMAPTVWALLMTRFMGPLKTGSVTLTTSFWDMTDWMVMSSSIVSKVLAMP